MNIKSILIVLMLIASMGVASADTVQVVKTQYPAFIAQFGIGEVLYKTTNNAGEVSYQLSRNGFKPLSITSTLGAVVNIPVGQTQAFTSTVTGCCKGLDGDDKHSHYLILYKDTTTGWTELDTYRYDVNYDAEASSTIPLGVFNTAGTYKYKIKEFIDLWSKNEYVRASGNSIYLTVQVGTPVPTYTTPQPTYTTPQPTYTTQPTATGTPPPSGDCVFGSFMINGKCAKVIPTPGFGIMFAVMGIIGVFLLTRRK